MSGDDTGRSALRSLLRSPEVLLAALAIATFAPAWGGEWVLDDSVAIVGSSCVTGPLDAGRIFASNFWCEPGPAWSIETWRPLTVLLWWVSWHAGGASTWAFDALNLGLHAGCVLALHGLARTLGLSARGSMTAAGLFAVLAVHADAVASHVGTAGLLAALLVMLAMRGTLRGGVEVVPLCVGAVLAKESGALAMPLVIVVALVGLRRPLHGAPESEAAERTRRRALALAALASVAVLLTLVARAEVLGSWSATQVPGFVNPLADVGLGARIVTGLDVVGDYVWLTLAGAPLAADYAYDSIGVGEHADVVGAAFGALLVVGLIAVGVWRRRDPASGVAVLWALGSLLFVSNILVVLPAIFAERMWYPGSAALCLLAGVALDTHERRERASRLVGMALAAFAALHIALAWRHAIQWRTSEGIVEATLAKNPRNARAHQWRANGHFAAGELDDALRHAEAALEIRPHAHESLVLVAILDDLGGRAPRAVNHFRRALDLAPHEPGVATPFIQFLLKHGNVQQAQFVYGVHAAARGGVPHPDVPRPPG